MGVTVTAPSFILVLSLLGMLVVLKYNVGISPEGWQIVVVVEAKQKPPEQIEKKHHRVVPEFLAYTSQLARPEWGAVITLP